MFNFSQLDLTEHRKVWFSFIFPVPGQEDATDIDLNDVLPVCMRECQRICVCVCVLCVLSCVSVSVQECVIVSVCHNVRLRCVCVWVCGCACTNTNTHTICILWKLSQGPGGSGREGGMEGRGSAAD